MPSILQALQSLSMCLKLDPVRLTLYTLNNPDFEPQTEQDQTHFDHAIVLEHFF